MAGGYTTKVYKTDGGDKIVVASGGVVEIASGGSIVNSGTTYIVTAPDDSTLEVAAEVLQVKDAGITADKLDAPLTALIDLLSNLPTVDPADGVTIWSDTGVLKLASPGGG